MKSTLVMMRGALLGLAVLGLFWTAQAAAADDRVGMREDCSTTQGWYELGDNAQHVPPRVKMESKDGLLYIHTNRGLLFPASRFKWPMEGVCPGSIIRKDFGEVDLDKYHYLVVNIKEKGSAVFVGINGFDTKTAYTTGITAVDLKDYDDGVIHGKRHVYLELDLHDNCTTQVIQEIKLVSELTADEQKGFIDRGLTIRDENLTFKPYHGLEALKQREKTPRPVLDQEEMTIFRDTATGAISTRLTGAPGDNYFGEGDIWSGDGAMLKFESAGRKTDGAPLYFLADSKVIATPKANWVLWSPVEKTKLWVISAKGKDFHVSLWDYVTGESTPITDFTVPDLGGYTEVKRFTKSGKLIIAFRETPHFYIIDPKEKKATYIKLSTLLKDAGISGNEQFVYWSNCYTYEFLWRNLKTGEQGYSSQSIAGHACGGRAGTVGSFGPFLKLFLTSRSGEAGGIGDQVKIWANWQNEVSTDYGTLTNDSEWIFTNGMRGDVANQHVMVPSKDTGAVLRIARYFTKFSWTSPTYSRPSPDYTKLIYTDNCIGSCQLIMVYTRRPDAPPILKLADGTLTWDVPRHSAELKGYNVYQSKASGRDFVKINDTVVTSTSYKPADPVGYFVVTAVENSALESLFSNEASAAGPRTLYFQAELQELTPPARPFFDGYCNNFQCVRINAESPKEKQADGVVSIDAENLPAGKYAVWGLVSGKGIWTVLGKAVPVDSAQFKWVKLADGYQSDSAKPLAISSRDDLLKIDTILLTQEDFTPAGNDPRDNTPPAPVKNVKAVVDDEKGQVTISWDKSPDADLNHYSVFCGTDKDFKCDNASVIRSVFKTSITDAGMHTGKPLVYKVVAYDSRWNASDPVSVEVPAMSAPAAKTNPATGEGPK